jgi:hypothetical protein
MEDAVVLAKAIPADEDAEDLEEAVEDAAKGNNSDHLKNVECFNCDKKGHYSTDCSLPRKNDNEQSNMVSKSISKTYSNPH